ncbi:hypothetical protein SAMN06269185_2813 [Natronoarchaeum philippinense]|uniref:Uncharacterized protein n=1 Tax=Natronoarchaeum philippinense TaxID=558529 RepID=A0A285P6N1_NATPI|nr:rod-determining factor RdfA [Natronoarchaeum philippinense]SNZ16917.1 hypothetical protein SAMN06269185_2813 [Natronoarchaeum philippinense]
MSEHDDSGEDCGCKVGRIIDQYDLAALNDDLVADWTGARGERRSLRQLAHEVNRRVLRSAMDEAAMEYRDGELENIYRILTDDDVSSGSRTETRRELEHASVPIEQVERDFVSHQTVHTHLTDCLAASIEEPDADERIENARDTVRALQNRTVAVTDDTIGRLDNADALSIGEYSVLVDVTVVCEDCGSHYTVGELLDAGACDCSGE